MYINLKTLRKKLKRGDLELLIGIKLNDVDYLTEELNEDDLRRFEDLKFISRVKLKKKGEHPYQCLRLSKEGKDFLSSLEEAEISEEDEKVFEWLKNHYIKIGKEIGNGAKSKRHIRDFRIKSGIEKNNLINLCLAFLSDEENMDYNHKMEFMFYKAPTAFETRFQLEESRLYKYYLKREPYFKSQFEEY